MLPTIYFVASVIPDELKYLLNSGGELPIPEQISSDRFPARGTDWAWIIQTFLYVKRAGLNVSLVDRLVEGAICVAYYDTLDNSDLGANSFIVGIRADNPPIHKREIEIVQSPANLGAPGTVLMNYWPQPRLVPRDPARGNRIERMSYFGGSGGLSPKYIRPEIEAALSNLGVEINLCFEPAQWGNYRQTDLVLAVRDHHHPRLIQTKPASKLTNSWRAGCVALLGNEPAYRHAGRCGQDYYEISSPEELLSVVKRLKDSPEEYQRLREAGMERAVEFSYEAIQKQWIALFQGPVREAYRAWKSERKGISRLTRRCVQLLHQWGDRQLFKIPVRSTELIENAWERLF